MTHINCSGRFGTSPLYQAGCTRNRLGRITEKTEFLEGETHTHYHTNDTAGRLIEVHK